MSDVGALAGVSLKSVSRVVNAEAHVSPELAERVQAAIDELGFQPDRRARGLASPPSARAFGFVQVDAANPFFAAVYRGLEDVSRDHGVMVLTGSTDADPDRERALLEALIEHRVDGLVVAAAEGSDALLGREIERGTPVVCVDRILTDPAGDTVVSDNRDSTRRAITHLHQQGHRRIAFLGGDPNVWTASERIAGYHDAARHLGIEPHVVTHVGRSDLAEHATRRLLAERPTPTAIFAAQDRITTGAIVELHASRRQHDIALFGFDELPFAEQLEPSISVIAQDPYAMGRRAAALLLERTAHPDLPPRFEVLPVEMRHRRSGDLPPSS
jgi:LacI family transcriptional regulator